MVKTLIKKYRVAVTLFSIRKNVRPQPYQSAAMNRKIKIIAPSKNTRILFFYKMNFSNIGNNNKFSEYS